MGFQKWDFRKLWPQPFAKDRGYLENLILVLTLVEDVDGNTIQSP